MELTSISLFSGAGGMDVGFMNAGYKVLWANDIDQNACSTYRANHVSKIICGDLRNYVKELREFKGVDVVFGGPPCQGFSVAGKMNPQDPRSGLIWDFMDSVEAIRPRAFVFENVKALATLKKWAYVRSELISVAEKLGYNSKIIVLKASDFGVPQSRERMFLIGFRNIDNMRDIECMLSQYRTVAPNVRQIFADLGVAGTSENKRVCRAKVTLASNPVLRRSPYAGMLFNGQGRPINPDGYSNTLPASMGGNRTPIIDEEHCHFFENSWVEWYHSHLISGGKPLDSSKVPKRLRRITVDEALRLQTFPKKYKFVGSQSSVYRQIGNAVPCKLAEAVAKLVKSILLNKKVVDEECKYKGEQSMVRLSFIT